jgi:murein DD-endopeptidase MepM/ murein hydrolase activator NlpD
MNWQNFKVSSIRIAICLLLCMTVTTRADIYKYQDSEGRWHFTDKPQASKQAEKVAYKSEKIKEAKFRLFNQQHAVGESWLMAENLYHAPVELSIKNGGATQVWVIKPLTIIKVGKAAEQGAYAWYLGDPKAKPSTNEYSFPIDISLCPKITQGFNGRFSHQKLSSKFAIDIGANVGTDILAAREGVVIAVKDDYAMGGIDDFFMDKANFVQVLHEDGTWALYAHILLGSAAVVVGDKVQVGDLLAKSGSSGYSSGPHLHFVIQKNAGLKSESLPFEFRTRKGNLVEPNFGQKLCEI